MFEPAKTSPQRTFRPQKREGPSPVLGAPSRLLARRDREQQDSRSICALLYPARDQRGKKSTVYCKWTSSLFINTVKKSYYSAKGMLFSL